MVALFIMNTAKAGQYIPDMKTGEIDRLKEKIDDIERAGGVVMLPDNVEKKLQSRASKILKMEEAKQKRYKSYFQPIGLSSYMDNPSLLLDSIVDACCSQGCVTEPDGHCEHGHPSVILYNGLI